MLDQVVALSKEVGHFLKSERVKITQQDIETKGRSNDLVSRADKEAERRFVDGLSAILPNAGFIAEEGTRTDRGERYNWIIDPLDGTTNYLYGIPCYCTSVALMDGNELAIGVIYDPERDECFAAERGKGATLNGQKIRVSIQSDLSKSLVAMGFPYDNKGKQAAYMKILAEVNTKTRGIRRLGSAALDLAYVACGRLDTFYEYGLSPWDCAAGALIVKEAGGNVTDFYGGADYVFGHSILSSNGQIHEAMLNFTKGWE